MKNILNAILNIINRSVRTSTYHQSSYNNRINAVGSALEEYMKDAFSDTFDEVDINTKNRIYNDNFSWLGNQNNPPDFILKECSSRGYQK